MESREFVSPPRALAITFGAVALLGLVGCPDDECERDSDCTDQHLCLNKRCVYQEPPRSFDSGIVITATVSDAGMVDTGTITDTGVIDTGIIDTGTGTTAPPDAGVVDSGGKSPHDGGTAMGDPDLHGEIWLFLQDSMDGSRAFPRMKLEDRAGVTYNTAGTAAVIPGAPGCSLRVEAQVSGAVTPLNVDTVAVSGANGVTYEYTENAGVFGIGAEPPATIFDGPNNVTFTLMSGNGVMGAAAAVPAPPSASAPPRFVSTTLAGTVPVTPGPNLVVELFDASREVVLTCRPPQGDTSYIFNTTAVAAFDSARSAIGNVEPRFVEVRNDLEAMGTATFDGRTLAVTYRASRGVRYLVQ